MTASDTLPRPPTSSALWTKNFVLLCFLCFAIYGSLNFFVPTIPLYVQSIGGDTQAIGLVVGTMVLSTVPSRLLAGWAVEVWGGKSVLLIAAVPTLVTAIAYNFAGSLGSVIALRILQGIGFGSATIAVSVLVVDLAPPHRRGEALGFFTMFGNVSMALAPGFAVWLTGITSFVLTGFQLVFCTASVLGVLMVACVLLLDDSSRAGPLWPSRPSLPLRSHFISPSALPVALTMLLLSSPLAAMTAFLSVYLPAPHVGFFFFTFAVLTMTTRPISGRLSDRYGRRIVLIPGIVCAAIGISLLAWSTALSTVIVSGVVFGAGWGMVFATITAVAADVAKPGERSAALGMVLSAIDVTISLGAMSLGVVASALGYPAVFLTAGLGCALGLVHFLTYAHSITRPETEAGRVSLT